MAILVKICGINSVDAADAAARAGADLAGLAFHPRSPRKLSVEQGSALSGRLRDRVRLVALTSDPDDELLAGVTAVVRPDFIQLHGVETPARAAAIRSRFGIPLIKAFPIAEAADFAPVAAYEDSVDMFLFDAKPPSGAEREGGHGNAFDWQILRGRKFARPWLLAGGLTPENVARAIQSSDATGVDASSGLETAPGQKSPELITQFVRAARSAPFGAAA
jgi:phosphoribosylanthranilate isomerase